MLIYYTIAEFTLLADGHRYFIFGMARTKGKRNAVAHQIFMAREQAKGPDAPALL